MKKINRYVCEYCKKHYDIEAEALECEAICKGEKDCPHSWLVYSIDKDYIQDIYVIARCMRDGCEYEDSIPINGTKDVKKIYEILKK